MMAVWGDLQVDDRIPENREGRGQGYFRYYFPDGKFEAIIAINGKLLRDGGDLLIEGLPTGFQTERMIEAVQYQDKMFFATGTKLVEYDGMTAKVVEPYKPQPLEALYVGLNGLAEFPDNFMQDGQFDYLRVEGLIPSLRKGIVKQKTTFTTFISKPGTEVIEYKYEYKLSNRDTFTLGKDWSTSKTWDFVPRDIGNYSIQVTARIQGTVGNTGDVPEVFQIPLYPVTAYDENEKTDTSQMNTCNRIMLHWERLIMYGDTKNGTTIYISHLQNPRYFPINNSLTFDNNEQESLTKLVHYRDFIVAFMPSSIQGLFGKAPTGDDMYTRMKLHTGIGCIAAETAKVMGNDIAFLSKEGVQIIQSFGITDDKMNVSKIDHPIASLIPADSQACAAVYDNQYHLCFPNSNKRFRFYYGFGVWTTDESPIFNASKLYEWNGDLIIQSYSTGAIYQLDGRFFHDDGFIYEDRLITKGFTFGEPHHKKKLKEVQLILGKGASGVEASASVLLDNNEIISTRQSYAKTIEAEYKQIPAKLISRKWHGIDLKQTWEGWING